MVQMLSFALFATVLYVSIAAIIATIKAELPYMLRAMGIDEAPALPPRQSTREPRGRLTGSPKELASRRLLRAAA
ncbi:MAG: hypothetical protein EOP61_26945 [Sphingomonadales bacterium]|nr:MAG: hypothetical protein EOP61_26945 [Sphingomonadales bacterium]